MKKITHENIAKLLEDQADDAEARRLPRSAAIYREAIRRLEATASLFVEGCPLCGDEDCDNAKRAARRRGRRK